MAEFAKILRYLGQLYPPSKVGYHNPHVLSEGVQLVQEAIPFTELFTAVQSFSLVGGATGQAPGDYVVPDGDDAPSGLPGAAIIIWAAEAVVTAVDALEARFCMNSATGGGGQLIGLATEGPQGGTRTVAVGSRMVLVKTPLLLPPKCRLIAVSTSNCGFNLDYFFSILQRGEPLPSL